MTFLVYLLLAVFLILLNAFFVLAEFAMVRMRSSRVEELADRGHARAKLVRYIQQNLDEYLAVCQLGITVASIGLGAVAEPGIAGLIMRVTGATSGAAHTAAVAVAVVLASVLHVVIGELVPKMIAIRRPERASFAAAVPLRVSRYLLYLPLVVLNGAATGILRLFGVGGAVKEAMHSEEELKIILAHSQSTGLLSFRRLLFLENIFDLGDVKVRDAMRPKSTAAVLRVGDPWEANLKVVTRSRFSRFPLLEREGEMPLGIVHVKDLFYQQASASPEGPDLRKIARPYTSALEDAPLENLLGELQKHRGHLAIVRNAVGEWVGIISLEDIVEEVIGTIEDEFELEPPIFLADALTPGRILLGLRSASLQAAITRVFDRVSASELPVPAERARNAVLERERALSTYLGKGVAIPHARLEGLEKPVVIFARSDTGIPIPGRDERAHLLFILLTPAASPRVQVRLLARIAGLLDSDYVGARLLEAKSEGAVLDAIRAADPTTVS